MLHAVHRHTNIQQWNQCLHFSFPFFMCTPSRAAARGFLWWNITFCSLTSDTTEPLLSLLIKAGQDEFLFHCFKRQNVEKKNFLKHFMRKICRAVMGQRQTCLSIMKRSLQLKPIGIVFKDVSSSKKELTKLSGDHSSLKDVSSRNTWVF